MCIVRTKKQRPAWTFHYSFLPSSRKDEKYASYLYWYTSLFVKIPNFVNQYNPYSENMPNYNIWIYKWETYCNILLNYVAYKLFP